MPRTDHRGEASQALTTCEASTADPSRESGEFPLEPFDEFPR